MCTGWRICFLAWLFTICSRTVAPATCRAVTRHRTTISGELRVWVWGAREARRFTSISFCCCTHSGSAISTSAYRLWINTRSTCTSPLADSDVLRVTSGAVWIRMSPPSGCRSARGYALLFAWKTSGRNNPRMQAGDRG
jgi:hypothetical protein